MRKWNLDSSEPDAISHKPHTLSKIVETCISYKALSSQ